MRVHSILAVAAISEGTLRHLRVFIASLEVRSYLGCAIDDIPRRKSDSLVSTTFRSSHVKGVKAVLFL